MTRSEYQELAEFVGKKFDRMDQRFDAVDRRLDAVEDRLRKVEVTQEQNRDLIKGVAEGVANVNERLNRFETTVADEFRAVRSEMSEGFTSVWAEFRTVRSDMSRGFKEQSKLIEGLDVRVGNLEARFGGWDARRN
jgi:predicted  nucleic acid-binding Zn-ribbon protein